MITIFDVTKKRRIVSLSRNSLRGSSEGEHRVTGLVLVKNKDYFSN